MKHIPSIKKDIFHTKSIFHKKLFFSISGFMTALIVICTIFFSLYTYETLHRQSQDNLQYLSERTAAELKTMIDNMDELALYASTNTEIRSAFVRAKHPDFSEFRPEQSNCRYFIFYFYTQQLFTLSDFFV